jgi:hypothetical protein
VRGPDGLDPRIVGLVDWALYAAGGTALGAVQRLKLNSKRSVLAERLWPSSPATALTVTNGCHAWGLAEANSKSAELGLALAYLMHAGQSNERVAIATGSLSRDSGPHNADSDTISVLPVAEIAEKISSIRQTLEQQRGAAFGKRVAFFLPKTTADGFETRRVYADALAAMQEDAKAHGVSIDVVPVATLAEAVRALGITGLVRTAADRWLTASIAAVLLFGVLIFVGHRWLNAPLALAFEPVTLSDGASAPTPLRAHYETGASVPVLEPPCLGDQHMPVYRVGDSLALRTAVAEKSPIAEALGGYHFAVLAVSETSGIKIYPPETFDARLGQGEHRSAAGAETSAPPSEISIVLNLAPPAEKSKLFILAQRLWPFDVAQLRGGLEQTLLNRAAGERINAAVSYLVGVAPGYIDYSFESSEGELECRPE